jgi:hypothetical protein
MQNLKGAKKAPFLKMFSYHVTPHLSGNPALLDPQALQLPVILKQSISFCIISGEGACIRPCKLRIQFDDNSQITDCLWIFLYKVIDNTSIIIGFYVARPFLYGKGKKRLCIMGIP